MTELEILRFSIDLLAPSAVLTPRVARYYMDAIACQQDNRIIYPIMPSNLLLEDRGDHWEVLKDFVHIHITAVGTSYQGIFSSVTACVLSHTRLDYFLGVDLPRLAQTAILKAPPYRRGMTNATWLELWEVDEERREHTLVRELSKEDLATLGAQTPDVKTIFDAGMA